MFLSFPSHTNQVRLLMTGGLIPYFALLSWALAFPTSLVVFAGLGAKVQ
jgi:hypothetical protein